MKKFAVPLQAFAALVICAGMAWMIFVFAGFDPTPPSVLDLQVRSTQDLSVGNMNSTAVALAKQMVSNLVPSPAGPILLPITGKGTATPKPMVFVTLKSIITYTETPTPYSFFTFLFPATPKKKSIDPTFTSVIVPTQTLPPNTAAPSLTPIPPSPTDLPPLTPLPTKLPPATNTVIPTDTPLPPSKIPDTNTPLPDPSTAVPPADTATSDPNTPLPATP